MATLHDRLVAENRKIIKQGEIKRQKEIATNMINKKLDEQLILELTGIEKEELEEIKNKIALVG